MGSQIGKDPFPCLSIMEISKHGKHRRRRQAGHEMRPHWALQEGSKGLEGAREASPDCVPMPGKQLGGRRGGGLTWRLSSGTASARPAGVKVQGPCSPGEDSHEPRDR